jgi:hypothetical protein
MTVKECWQLCVGDRVKLGNGGTGTIVKRVVRDEVTGFIIGSSGRSANIKSGRKYVELMLDMDGDNYPRYLCSCNHWQVVCAKKI